MLSRFSHNSKVKTNSVETSKLFNQDTFYLAFEKDLRRCKDELIIESPFITIRRINSLLPRIKTLLKRGVRIVINTRSPEEHDIVMHAQAHDTINILLDLGVEVLFTGGHHRKLAIIDRNILWEGSLDILSQNSSCEVMRRIDSQQHALQMLTFTGLGDLLRGY